MNLKLNLPDLCWPPERLGDAMAYLLSDGTRTLPPPPSAEAVPDWLDWAALRCNAEQNRVDFRLRDLDRHLRNDAPALYRLSEGSFLLVLRAGRTLRVLAPNLAQRDIDYRQAAAALRAPYQEPHRCAYDALVAATGAAASSQPRLLAQLLKAQTGDLRFQNGWTFRSTQMSSGLWRSIPRLLGCHAAQYLLWLASWAVLGTLSFTGHMDRGWLLAWSLLLITLTPFRLLTTWFQGTFAIHLGAILKRKLLQGALRLRPDEVRAGGVGTYLGQALEAETIESLSISGGITGLLAFVELIPSLFVLGRFAPVLAGWCLVAAFVAFRFYRSSRSWTAQRLDLTQHLVESMVGHRTRLAQQKPAGWHSQEDEALVQYLQISKELDHTGSWLVAALPRGWLILGLACITPSLVSGKAMSSETAVLLGGVLLAYSAFQRLVASLVDITLALGAWLRIKPLFEAANRRELVGDLPPLQPTTATASRLLEADRLTFRYKAQGPPALQGCNLVVHRGDRLLLEGPSGGGKTTLASLLSGLRQPDSGLLLIRGLDRHTLGETAWRKQVAAAPQFHENHILTGTLAFNLLLGRAWPASQEDLQDAEEVCHDLGLADLLARMPSGLLQMVGEGGWQLSHGERSRIFLARALLQQSPLVILDESFAALDPENLHIAMHTTLHRAETLLVIAHP